MKWRRLNGDPILEIKEKVEQTIIEETQKGHRLKVCIGTDSQVKGNSVEFACVIVFLREKKGGFMYINNYRMEKKEMSLKQRMILEVSRSVEVAYNLCDLFDQYDIEMEIHADINTDPYFASNMALKEAMGYILGMGFAFKAKPDAFASSSCADKVV